MSQREATSTEPDSEPEAVGAADQPGERAFTLQMQMAALQCYFWGPSFGMSPEPRASTIAQGEARTEVTTFDPHGDTRLVLYGDDDDDDDVRHIFVVSSKAMAMVCGPWDRTLSPDGHFREARAEGDREIELPDDDPRGLEILLNIAHLRFYLVSRTLPMEDLSRVALVTEKYGAMRLIRPWIRDWLREFHRAIGEIQYELTRALDILGFRAGRALRASHNPLSL